MRAKYRLSLTAMVFVASAAVPHEARAFSQGSLATQIGHEYITSVAAYNLHKRYASEDNKGYKRLLKRELTPRPLNQIRDDLRCRSIGRTLQGGREQLATLTKQTRRTQDVPASEWPLGGYGCDNTWGASNTNVAALILGQQWIDTMGFVTQVDGFAGILSPAHDVSGATERYTQCFNAVAQEQETVQEDHFLRRRSDQGEEGKHSAHGRAVKRIRDLFFDAVRVGKQAMKNGHPDPTDKLTVLAGGDFIRVYSVPKTYFHLGLALHAFEDSFSPEHVVRTPDWHEIVDVASYTCQAGAPPHTHKLPTPEKSSRATGDVIWTSPDITSLSNALFVNNPALYTRDSQKLSSSAHAAIAATEFFLWHFFAALEGGNATPERAWKAIEDTWLQLRTSPKALAKIQYHRTTAEESKACSQGINSHAVVIRHKTRCMAQLTENGSPLMKDRPAFYWGGILYKAIDE